MIIPIYEDNSWWILESEKSKGYQLSASSTKMSVNNLCFQNFDDQLDCTMIWMSMIIQKNYQLLLNSLESFEEGETSCKVELNTYCMWYRISRTYQKIHFQNTQDTFVALIFHENYSIIFTKNLFLSIHEKGHSWNTHKTKVGVVHTSDQPLMIVIMLRTHNTHIQQVESEKNFQKKIRDLLEPVLLGS